MACLTEDHAAVRVIVGFILMKVELKKKKTKEQKTEFAPRSIQPKIGCQGIKMSLESEGAWHNTDHITHKVLVGL